MLCKFKGSFITEWIWQVHICKMFFRAFYRSFYRSLHFTEFSSLHTSILHTPIHLGLMNLIPAFKALFNKKEEDVFWVADVFQFKKQKGKHNRFWSSVISEENVCVLTAGSGKADFCNNTLLLTFVPYYQCWLLPSVSVALKSQLDQISFLSEGSPAFFSFQVFITTPSVPLA